jgi:hypothetical protein
MNPQQQAAAEYAQRMNQIGKGPQGSYGSRGYKCPPTPPEDRRLSDDVDHALHYFCARCCVKDRKEPCPAADHIIVNRPGKFSANNMTGWKIRHFLGQVEPGKDNFLHKEIPKLFPDYVEIYAQQNQYIKDRGLMELRQAEDEKREKAQGYPLDPSWKLLTDGTPIRQREGWMLNNWDPNKRGQKYTATVVGRDQASINQYHGHDQGGNIFEPY